MRSIKLIILLLIFNIQYMYSQSLDEDRIVLGNFIERLYNNAPFEGCRLIDDYDNSYLISVVAIDASSYKTKTQLNRMAQIKSQRNAGEFLNGVQSFSEFIVQTPKSKEKGTPTGVVETVEYIKTNTSGYVQQMQFLKSFLDDDHLTVFVYFKELK